VRNLNIAVAAKSRIGPERVGKIVRTTSVVISRDGFLHYVETCHVDHR
jgi:hypothetical protein